MDIVLYCFAISLFIAVRLFKAKKNREKCKEKLYVVPIKTYFWQIAGMTVILVMLTGLVYMNTQIEVQTYMPRVCFTLMIALIAGFCAFSIVLFGFTPVGLYANGLLTHYMFLSYNDVESYELVSSNMLNIGRETKTLTFTLKNNASNHPSFEYPIRDEEKIVEMLKALGLYRAAKG